MGRDECTPPEARTNFQESYPAHRQLKSWRKSFQNTTGKNNELPNMVWENKKIPHSNNSS